jgi:hypothetical protein
MLDRGELDWPLEIPPGNVDACSATADPVLADIVVCNSDIGNCLPIEAIAHPARAPAAPAAELTMLACPLLV